MKQIFARLAKLLILMTLLLSWGTSQALETYKRVGELSQISNSSFKIDDQKYWLTPTAKLNNPTAKRARFGDLKKGDSVWFTGTILDGRYYVDAIYYMPKPLL